MELLKRQETWNITYTHALGETASWFYVQLRDHAKLYGKRDAKSGRVLVPPRAFSDQTLEPTTDWVEVGPGGKIETFTITYEEFNGLPPPPYAFGYVLLDGAEFCDRQPILRRCWLFFYEANRTVNQRPSKRHRQPLPKSRSAKCWWSISRARRYPPLNSLDCRHTPAHRTINNSEQ